MSYQKSGRSAVMWIKLLWRYRMKKIIFWGFVLTSMTVFSAGDDGVYKEVMMETISEKVASYERDPVKKKEIGEKKEKGIKIRRRKIENKNWEEFSLHMMMGKESSRK